MKQSKINMDRPSLALYNNHVAITSVFFTVLTKADISYPLLIPLLNVMLLQ